MADEGLDPLASWLRGLDREPQPGERAPVAGAVDPQAIGPLELTPNPDDGPSEGEPLAGAFFREALQVARSLATSGRKGMGELGGNVRAWLDFNRARLAWLYQALRPRDRITFSAIPFLLHVNVPGLPGHVASERAPRGVAELELNPTIRQAVDALFPSRTGGGAAAGPPVVRSVLVMGSVGTIGQTGASDVDYWIVVDEAALGPGQREQLLAKLDGIEAWARQRGLEAHFFLVDVERARRDDFGGTDADPDSSGSAQGKLLKEEFYRTAVYLAGELPLWWVAPVGVDAAGYARLALAVQQAALPAGLGFVDLGFVGDIDPGEFFGAALWQINKSLRSPFKSLLKMALLARYLDAARPELLCEQLKARVFQGERAPQFTDPYVLLFDAISEYFAGKGDWDAFRLVQKCFYLKVGLKLSRANEDRSRFMRRFRVMRAYIARWGWDRALLADLDSLEVWSAEKVDAFGQEIRELMLGLYRQLVERARTATVRINENDLTILGRRLFACFGREPGKVRHLFTYFLREPRSEDRLVVMETALGDDARWQIHRHVAPERLVGLEAPMWSGATLTEAAAWLTFNGLFHKGTVVGLVPRRSARTTTELRQLLERFHGLFECPDPFEIPPPTFLAQRRVRRVALVVNFEAAAAQRAAADDELVYLPENWDVLNYGRRRECRVTDVTLVTLDSWGELFCRRFAGPMCLPQALRTLYAQIDAEQPLDGEPEVLAPHDRTLPAVRHRVRAILENANEVFLPALGAREGRTFVYEVGGRFQVVQRGPDTRRLCVARTLSGVLRLLGDAGADHKTVHLDRLSPSLADLRALLERHEADREASIYVGWRVERERAHVVVCDELRRFHLTAVPAARLEARLLLIVRRILERLRQHVRSAYGLRRALRIFELREGLGLGESVRLVEDTVRVLGELARPRPTRPELRLRGDARAGRRGIGILFGDTLFSPDQQGSRFPAALLRRVLNERSSYDPDLLTIAASDVDFGPSHAPNGHDLGVVKHLRLIDLYERRLGRALAAYRGGDGQPARTLDDTRGEPRSG